MKKKNVDLLGLADERYIDEADPTVLSAVSVRRKRTLRSVLAVAAVVLALLVALVAVFPLFKGDKGPGGPTGDAPSGGSASPSEYRDIYEKLLTLKRYDGDFVPEPEPGDDGEGGYKEVTDNQVAGVIEGDRIKRSDRHIYYLSDGALHVYSIDGPSSKKVSEYPLPVKEGRHLLEEQAELFLSEDCKQVTVFMETYGQVSDMQVSVLVLDVSDPEDVVCLRELAVCGSYEAARQINDTFLLTTYYVPDMVALSDTDPETFVPHIKDQNEKGEAQSRFPDQIVVPKELTNGYYTVLTMLSTDLQVYDMTALLSYGRDLYVTTDHVVAYRGFGKNVEKDERSGEIVRWTELLHLPFDGERKRFGTAELLEIEGDVKDRYSLDIYSGSLRAVTSTVKRRYEKTETGATHFPGNTQQISANLYCIDLESMTIKGQVIGFAPQGETVQSARFDGNSAYVCTAVSFTDPVFFFDLTDPKNITYKETAEIEGFSSSLVSLGNGFLLGIGVSGFDTLKVEIYKEGQSAVEPVCVFALERVWFSSEYKSYYIDRENGLLGLGYTSYEEIGNENARYLVLHFDGEGIELLLDEQLTGHATFKRGVYIDGYYYMLGLKSFKVFELNLEG